MSFLGGLWDSFTGAGAEKKLQQGRGELIKGRDAAIGDFTNAGTQAQGRFAGLGQGSEQADKLYYDSSGANGTAARDAAQQLYLSDPLIKNQLAQANKVRGWQSNAGGGYGSGADALAAARIQADRWGQQQQLWGDQGGRAMQLAGARAGIDQWQGAGEAGANMSAANGLNASYGDSAKNANTLGQNVIGLGGLAVSAMTGVPVGMGRGTNNISSQPGTSANGGWSTTTTGAPQPSWWNRMWG